MHTDLATLCIGSGRSIHEVIALLDINRLGIALVVDEDRRLLGTVTDGDVRRAVLAKMDLRQPVSALLAMKAGTSYAKPITAPIGQDPSVYLDLLKQHTVLHLPLLDAEGRVACLIRMADFVPDGMPSLQAVVMAGGVGARLHPLTEETPKPMLPLGDQPLLEIIIRQLREAGIRQVTVTTHHRPEKIADHFGDGRHFGVELSYVEEDRPLGTVGGLALLKRPNDTTLIINGDILTQVDFRAMVAYHREHRADLTIAVRHYEVAVPYGVVECEGPVVRAISEKPMVGFFVNAGIYLLEPVVYDFIPSGQRLDMTELIQRLLEVKRPVVSFPVREYWLDIGQPEDYEQAQEQIKSWKQA